MYRFDASNSTNVRMALIALQIKRSAAFVMGLFLFQQTEELLGRGSCADPVCVLPSCADIQWQPECPSLVGIDGGILRVRGCQVSVREPFFHFMFSHSMTKTVKIGFQTPCYASFPPNFEKRCDIWNQRFKLSKKKNAGSETWDKDSKTGPSRISFLFSTSLKFQEDARDPASMLYRWIQHPEGFSPVFMAL